MLIHGFNVGMRYKSGHDQKTLIAEGDVVLHANVIRLVIRCWSRIRDMRTGNNHYGCLVKVYTTDIVATNREKLYPSRRFDGQVKENTVIDDMQLVKRTKSQEAVFIRANIVL